MVHYQTLGSSSDAGVIEALQVRWQVEEFHPIFKQLTGAEKC